MRIKVIPLIGPHRKIELDVHPNTLIRHFIEQVCDLLELRETNIRLSYNGRVLNEFATFAEESAKEEEAYLMYPQGEGG
ncbi:MAG: hypothetical protein NZ920_02185 [Aigarchaeota archaeon]|nr:hypothetical protein [Aigarchaeota archaeon]MDW8092565.1 hypothetical protein [Nitrososphaerota archaeon]